MVSSLVRYHDDTLFCQTSVFFAAVVLWTLSRFCPRLDIFFHMTLILCGRYLGCLVPSVFASCVARSPVLARPLSALDAKWPSMPIPTRIRLRRRPRSAGRGRGRGRVGAAAGPGRQYGRLVPLQPQVGTGANGGGAPLPRASPPSPRPGRRLTPPRPGPARPSPAWSSWRSVRPSLPSHFWQVTPASHRHAPIRSINYNRC